MAARGLVGRGRDPGRVFRIVAATGLAAGLATLTVGAAGLGRTASTAAPASSPAFSTASPAPIAASTGYAAPVPGPVRVLRPFDPPLTRYGPGHRGVDLGSSRAGPILAAGDGVVRFAGPVGGRGVIVVQHPDGIATEYEPVRAAVRAGQPVRRGQPIGRLAGRHPGCATWCLHWGARRDEAYLDPLALLRALGPVRLLPWRPDG
jgi:murein DD-endopeptidase MepM/ murein hydrolase activator NlpD